MVTLDNDGDVVRIFPEPLSRNGAWTKSGTEYGSGVTGSSYSASGSYSPGVTNFNGSNPDNVSISPPNLPHLGFSGSISASGTTSNSYSYTEDYDYDQTVWGSGGGQSVSNVHSDSTSTSTLDGFVLNLPTSGDGLQLGTSKGVGSLCFPHALCNFPGRKHRAISGPARWRCKRCAGFGQVGERQNSPTLPSRLPLPPYSAERR